MNDDDASVGQPGTAADPHAEFHRQAVKYFGGSNVPAQQPPPAGQAGDTAGDSPTTPIEIPYSPRPTAGAQPHAYPAAGPTPGTGPVDPGGTPRTNPGAAPLVLAAAVLFAVLILRSLLGSFPAALLLTFLDAALVLGYLAFRQQKPNSARNLETRALAAADRFIAKLTPAMGNAAHTLSERVANAAAPHPGLPGQTAGSRPVPPMIGYPPGPASHYPQAPGPPAFAPVSAGMAGQPTRQPATQILVSAILVAASMIPYAIIYYTPSFSSVWQPWLLDMSVIAVLIVVIAGWSRPGANRALALLFALAGAAVYVFATVPSTSWGMKAMLSNALLKSDYSWSEAQNLVLWAGRLPILAVAAFVLAWGIARRRHPVWLLGLIPTGIAIAVAIWYIEKGSADLADALQSSPAWFVAWLIFVGPFVVGCLACWAADAVLAPRSPGPYPGGVVYPS